VSGGWHPAFDAVCDAVTLALDATRIELPGYGHSIPDLGAPFNDALATFVDGVEQAIAATLAATADTDGSDGADRGEPGTTPAP
jgi:hypothetical protein